MMKLRTCVLPCGDFTFGIHKPAFDVKNLRTNSWKSALGKLEDGKPVYNEINFPEKSLREEQADWIFEIPNVFPFRGTTYIASRWAEKNAEDPESICLQVPEKVSLSNTVQRIFPHPPGSKQLENLLRELPRPLLIALASSSTDPRDLI